MMKKLSLVLFVMLALVGLKANAAMYIVGNVPFGNWNPGAGVEMIDNGDGTYSYTATINGTVYFVFGDGLNNDWDIFNPDYRYGPTNGNEEVTTGNWKATQKAGDHGSYFFTGTGDEYVFTFDEINSQFKVEGYVEPINPLTGELFALGQVNGNNWDPSAGIAMATTDENVFTLTDAEITDSGEGYGFFSFTSKLGEHNEDWSIAPYRRGAKADGTLVEDGVAADLAGWGSTFAFKVVPGKYDIEVNLSENTVLLTRKGGDVPPPVEITVYTVAGPETIFGSDWDATDENNDMTEGVDGIYTWTKDNVALYGNFEFKVAGNHSFSVYEWPIGMNNWVAHVAEEGIYTIEITFDPEAADSLRIACNLTKTGDVGPINHTYTVAGTQNVFGSDWNPADEANDMVLGEDGIYTWTKKGVVLAVDEEVKFKVAQDHAWTYAWPSSDWIYKCTEAGTYDIVITFDPKAEDANKINFTATLVPEYVRGDVDMDDFVKISDVTALVNYLLSGNSEGINLKAADCDEDGFIKISDVTTLINFLLTGQWPL